MLTDNKRTTEWTTRLMPLPPTIVGGGIVQGYSHFLGVTVRLTFVEFFPSDTNLTSKMYQVWFQLGSVPDPDFAELTQAYVGPG